MRFSEAKGRKVVSIDSADTVGKIVDYVLDPSTASIAALKLSRTTGAGDTLPWHNIKGFGVDAVTVPTADSIVVADAVLAELADRRHALHNKRVLTQSGVDLGVVIDVDFNPETGQLTALLLREGEVEGSRLAAIGSYAAVVKV